MPFQRLHDQDPVVQSLRLITRGRLLAPFTRSRILANGKIEKQLKLFLAIAWIRGGRNRACVMDKRFNGRELDLLALQNAKPRYWIETKCDFREAPREAEDSACDALEKIYRARAAFHGSGEEDDDEPADDKVAAFTEEVRSCPAYIVHFLNSVPRKDDPRHPSFILRKFPRKSPIDLKALRAYYEKQCRAHVQVKVVHRVNGKTHPQIDALVLKFCSWE